MPTSEQGTVHDRPDERWTYVVEKPLSATDLSGPWVSVGCYDNQSDAVSHAEELPISRVRTFKQAHVHQDAGIAHSVFTSKPISGEGVPLVTMTCLTHGDQRIAMSVGGTVPRCPVCSAKMVTGAFAKALSGKVKVLR